MVLNNTQLFINDDFPFIRNMSIIAAKIAYYNFEWRYVTLIMFNSIKVIVLATFLSNYKQSVLLKVGQFMPHKRAAILQFVLFGQEASEISGMLRWLAQNQYDTSGKYIIHCYANDSNKCSEKEMFDTLASVYITNVLLIKGSLEMKEPIVYSYYLVLPEKCMNSEPMKMNISLSCSNDTCFKSAFPDKFSNMYQCPFVVSTVEQHPYMYMYNDSVPEGKDGDLLTLVVQILNASLVLITPKEGSDWGEYVDNDWTGSLGDVFNDRADASMCPAPLTPAKYGNFQISFTYSSMDIVWAAGLPDLKPPWEKLLYPLPMSARIIIFFMFIGIVFMNTFTKTCIWRKVIRALKIGPPKSNLLFYSWVIFVGLPVIKMPSKPTLLIAVGMWIWFSFIIRTVYQAALINIMKQSIYAEPFDSFQEVLASRRPFGGHYVFREYYSEDKFVYDSYIGMNLAEARQTADLMANGSSNFVIAMNKETVLFRLIKYKGTRHLQIIPQKIVNSPTVIFFRRFSFFATPVSRILSVSLEGGFSQRLFSRFFSRGMSLIHHSNKQRTEPLRLEQFMGSFFILASGWFISAIFFCVEVICGRLIDASLNPFIP